MFFGFVKLGFHDKLVIYLCNIMFTYCLPLRKWIFLIDRK